MKPVVVKVIAGAVLFSAHSLAQSPTSDTMRAAEALFHSGRDLLNKGDYAAACPKLEKSLSLDPALGTQLYLAECFERQGKTASAWSLFADAAAKAGKRGEKRRAKTAAARASALSSTLSRLTITVPSAVAALPGFRLMRAKTQVKAPLFGVAVPVDPGDYELVASADGYKPWTGSAKVPKKNGRVKVDIPMLEKEPDAGTASAPVEPAPVETAPPPDPAPVAPPTSTAPPQEDAGDGSGQRTLGLIIGGVGIVGVAIGSVFGLNAISTNKDAEEFCPRGNKCDDQKGIDLTDDANSAATVSNVAFGVGGVALITGAILFFSAPSDAPRTGWRGLRFGGGLGSNGGGLTARGTF